MLRQEREKGQGLAELALALPILLMVVFGMVEMARLVQTYLAVQHAAREGARYAVVGLPSEEECVYGGGDTNGDGVCDSRLVSGEVCTTEYSTFRAEEIKEKAREAAVGLPWDPAKTNESSPGYLGVRVQGQPSFYDDCDPAEDCLDCPGVPGARVKVEVCFNMPVITPILSGALPTVRVCADTQMVNEGFQTWVGAQAPPILEPLPSQEPLDTDGDGLYDSEEYTDRCPWVTNPDSDYDGFTDATEIAAAWTPCDPYSPYTPTPEQEPPTPTNTATPTPVPFRMNKPLLAGSSRITGSGDWTYPPQVHIIDNTTGQEIGSGTIKTTDPGKGSFTIDLPSPLLSGHQITAIGSYPGARDSAIVTGATYTPTNTPTSTNTPTPTSTRTPTATPTPSTRISILSPEPPPGMIYSCTDDVGSPLNLTVQGTGWPASAEVLFGWDGTGAAARSYTGNAEATPDGGGNFTASFTVAGGQVTEGLHTVYALVLLTGQQAEAVLYVPCSSVPTPTPTWTATPTNTPTFTPTPIRPPDLRISDLTIQTGTIVTGTEVTINTTVLNDSTGPCNNTFWTDLYVRTEPTPPAFREDGVKYQALTYLGPNSSKAIEFKYTFAVTDTYYIYTQADTYENVSEGNESNNWRGPLEVQVEANPNPPTATPTATPAQHVGSISGSVAVFIGGQLVVPTQRVNLSLWKGASPQPVATTVSDEGGGYRFSDVPVDTSYLVDAYVIIDDILYFGYQAGIQVVEGQETSPVDIILFPP